MKYLPIMLFEVIVSQPCFCSADYISHGTVVIFNSYHIHQQFQLWSIMHPPGRRSLWAGGHEVNEIPLGSVIVNHDEIFG